MVTAASSVSHRSPSMDVLHEDAQSSSLLELCWVTLQCWSVHVGMCMHVSIYTWTQPEVAACQSLSITHYFCILTYYLKGWKGTSSLQQPHYFPCTSLNLHSHKVHLRRIIKPRNQRSQRTGIKINHGHATTVANSLQYPMGSFLCQPDEINKSWQGNPCWHLPHCECFPSRRLHLNIWRQHNHVKLLFCLFFFVLVQ